MPPPLDPKTKAALDRLVKALNNLAVKQTREQRLADDLATLIPDADVAFVSTLDSRVYDQSDAIQLIQEIARGILPLFEELTPAQSDQMFLRILTTLPKKLLPGVGPAERVRADSNPFLAKIDGAVTIKAINIHRFPQNAVLGMQQGAIAVALYQNGRISQEALNAYLSGGTATSDEVARQVIELYRSIRDNLPDIINAATGEAEGADLIRAVSSHIKGESEEDLLAGKSLYPIIPGFGVPELKKFTEDEATDLRENFPKLLKDVLPTTNQVGTVEERTARRQFIDDVADEARAILAFPGTPDDEKLRRLQIILDSAPDRFEVVREATVAETEAEGKDLATRLGTPEAFKKTLSNLPGIPTAHQLDTQEEKDARDRFLDDTVREAEAAAAAVRASPLGFTEREILEAKQAVLDGAPSRWQTAQLIATNRASADEKIEAAKKAFAEAEKAAPTTVAKKDAILSAAFQSEEFQSEGFQAILASLGIEGPVEFDNLTAEVKAQARAEISGMSAEEATAFASQNTLMWAHASFKQKKEEKGAPAVEKKELNELIGNVLLGGEKDLTEKQLTQLREYLKLLPTREQQEEAIKIFAPLLVDVGTEEEKAAIRKAFEADAARDLIDDALEAGGAQTTDISERDKVGLIADFIAAVKGGQQPAEALLAVIAPKLPDLVDAHRETRAAEAAAQREEPGIARGITRNVLDDNDIGELSDDRLKELEDSVEKYGVKEFQSWVENNVDALKDESKQFEAAAEAEDFSRTDAEKQVRDFYVNSGYNIGEIPDSIIARDAAEVFRAGGLSPALGEEFIGRLEGEVDALGFRTATKSAANLEAFGLSIASEAEVGIIGPTTSAEFAQFFTDSTIPKIAQAAALSGLTTTEELRQFFLDEFRLQLKPGEIAPSRSNIGLTPADVRESDFQRQFGFTGPLTARALGIRPEAPLPTAAESQFLPFARAAAGEDPNLFRFLLGELPELEQGFRTARQGFQSQLELENLQQATQFAQSPERLADLEARLKLAESGQRYPGSGQEDVEAIRSAIAQQRANLQVSENMGAFRGFQTTQTQSQVQGFSPEKFFEERRAGLVEGFRSTPTGFAGEVAARRRAEADVERAARQTEVDTQRAETERRRQLRGRGRTVMRV